MINIYRKNDNNTTFSCKQTGADRSHVGFYQFRVRSVNWRIKTKKGYRYFTQKDVNGYMLQKQIAETPIETLQKRNNVEATIFQLGYHYSNAKSKYRGQIKHQMWANIRCLWVNFVRILKYIKKLY